MQTVKQIELYNTQMKDEIAVTRRATYAAEENISKKEKEKSEQDMLLDTLHEELKALKKRYTYIDTIKSISTPINAFDLSLSLCRCGVN